MTLSRLEQLYRAVILDHYQHPHHRGRLAAPTHSIQMVNPSCGDILTIDLQIDEGRIIDLAFDGQGCAISVASASMMSDLVIGQRLDQLAPLVGRFQWMITSPQETDAAEDQALLGDAALLAGVRKFPARVKCATLAWQGLEEISQEASSKDKEDKE